MRALSSGLEELFVYSQANHDGHELSTAPDIAVINDQTGEFVIVWPDYPQNKVYFQRFDSYGSPIDANGVNLLGGTLSTRPAPAVDGLGNGGFLVVWNDMRLGLERVFGQYVDPQGEFSAAQNVRLDDQTSTGTENPKIAIFDYPPGSDNLAFGMLTWVGVNGPCCDADDVFARGFSFFVDPVDPLTQAWISGSGCQGVHLDSDPAAFDGAQDMTVDQEGVFSIVWKKSLSADQVKWATFSSCDSIVWEDTLYTASSDLLWPSISSFHQSYPDTAYVVAWSEGGAVNAQLYSQTGDTATDVVPIFSGSPFGFLLPRVAAFRNSDDYAITWPTLYDGTNRRILAEVFHDTTSLYDGQVQIGTATDNNLLPRIDTFRDRIYVTWKKEDANTEKVYCSVQTVDNTGPSIDTTSAYPSGPVLYDTLSTYVLPVKVRIWDDSARIDSGFDHGTVTWTRICPRPPAVNGTGPLQRIAGTDSFYFDLPEIESPGTEIRYYITAVDSALNARDLPPGAPDDPRHLFVANLGDINLNSIIDEYDVALVEDVVCTPRILEPYELVFADYNQDSLWTCADVDSIRKYAVAAFDPDTLPSCLPDNQWSITRYPLELGVGGAPAGQTDTIPVYLDNDSSSVKGVHIEVGYDGARFGVVDTATTPRTTGYSLSPPCCEPPDSSFALAGIPTPVFDRYDLYGPDSIPPGTGSILDLEFSVDDSTPAGYYHFYLTRDVLYGPDHKPVYTMPLRGKFFVPAPPPVSIVTTPVADTLLSPGDTLTFNTTLTNHSDSTKSPKFFVYGTTTGPDSFTFLAVDTSQIMVLPAGGRKRDLTDLEVPAGAPTGHYVFTAYVSDDSVVMDEDPFGFRVNGQSKPGAGGDRLLPSGGVMRPWRVLSGWFGYNEHQGGGGEEGARASEIPKSFSAPQNYPNPFNPSTTIAYDIPAGATSVPVRIRIYDLRGRLVRTLVDEKRAPGRHAVHWDGRDDRGRETGSGVYLYRLEAGTFRSTRKMVVAR